MKKDFVAKEIRIELDKFAKVEATELKSIVKKAASMGVKKLKKTSPKKTGAYRKGWTQRTDINKASRTSIVIHNKDRYNITMLLEKGHVGIAHGKRFGTVKAIPHIAPVEQEVYDYIDKETNKRL